MFISSDEFFLFPNTGDVGGSEDASDDMFGARSSAFVDGGHQTSVNKRPHLN